MQGLLRSALGLVVIYMMSVAYLWFDSERQNAYKQTQADQKANQVKLRQNQHKMQSGYLTTVFDKEGFHSDHLTKAIDSIPGRGKNSNFIWQDRAGNPFAYAAMGIDRNYYFANSYLVGYQPYKTTKLWQPLVTLALKKTYQFDHDQHGANWKDIWQNSKQAYYYSHGDCEDHAILLADWLISMGYDARVAIGKVPSGGHAWVILYYDNKEYLLEATSKRRPRSIGDFKLAKFAAEYRPEYLFNRDSFWANTGTHLTTRYSGNHWIKTATFILGATPAKVRH